MSPTIGSRWRHCREMDRSAHLSSRRPPNLLIARGRLAWTPDRVNSEDTAQRAPIPSGIAGYKGNRRQRHDSSTTSHRRWTGAVARPQEVPEEYIPPAAADGSPPNKGPSQRAGRSRYPAMARNDSGDGSAREAAHGSAGHGRPKRMCQRGRQRQLQRTTTVRAFVS